MPKFLVHQKLPADADPWSDHLEPGAEVLYKTLLEPDRAEIRWLWGCANIDVNEYHMLYQAPDRESVVEFMRRRPGVVSIEQVLHVTPENVGGYIVKSLWNRSKDRVEQFARDNTADDPPTKASAPDQP